MHCLEVLVVRSFKICTPSVKICCLNVKYVLLLIGSLEKPLCTNRVCENSRERQRNLIYGMFNLKESERVTTVAYFPLQFFQGRVPL